MTNERFIASPSGVLLASDFRDNLIIDRFDPIFAGMRASKLKHLRSENSEDAVTWNVFRSLRQIDPKAWLPHLVRMAFQGVDLWHEDSVIVRLWQPVCPPPSLVRLGDEGESEIDVVVESPFWVWFIEAKYRSDISARTTLRADRDQVLRNVDVGSYYAGTRPFYFSLLILSPSRSPQGVKAVDAYSDIEYVRSKLAAHRPDGVQNVRALSVITWGMLAAVLRQAEDNVEREDERGYAKRAFDWLQLRGLAAGAEQDAPADAPAAAASPPR